MLALSTPQQLFSRKGLYHINGLAGEKFSEISPAKVLLLYEYAEPELPGQLKGMLEKILLACKYKQEDAAFINVKYKSDIIQGSLWSLYNPELILLFGNIKLSRNTTALKKNVPYTFGKLKMIQSETLEILDKNSQEKQALWNSLKQMLGL